MLDELKEAANQAPAGCAAATPNKVNNEKSSRMTMALLVMSLVCLGALWYGARTGGRTLQVLRTPNVPITLTDQVEHLPALAWKAIPLSLPYRGTVEIQVQVVRGNPIDVFLTTPNQLDNVERVQWNSLKIYAHISATRMRTFRRAARLGPGGFYLVVRDMTVGMPSSPPTDVSVKVQLNP